MKYIKPYNENNNTSELRDAISEYIDKYIEDNSEISNDIKDLFLDWQDEGIELFRFRLMYYHDSLGEDLIYNFLNDSKSDSAFFAYSVNSMYDILSDLKSNCEGFYYEIKF